MRAWLWTAAAFMLIYVGSAIHEAALTVDGWRYIIGTLACGAMWAGALDLYARKGRA
jgi:hypothetical protein